MVGVTCYADQAADWQYHVRHCASLAGRTAATAAAAFLWRRGGVPCWSLGLVLWGPAEG